MPETITIPIVVYESDGLRMSTDLHPERWQASQRLVTKEELSRLEALLAHYKDLQDLLKEIHARPEYDPFETEA